MEQFSKGKPVTTSVPTISIKFHANAEQLEELYASDDEHNANDAATAQTGAAGVSEPESSPLKLLPRLVKRSTSIDITPNPNIDASPPSDPWRFFSDIKGKITKSVEEKITEIKARNQDEGSPLKTKVKDSKENSSLSDSEDLSESSISKTCGIFSTTEGAEMSSDDDDTPSIEKDRNVGLRQRFRLLKSKSSKEGTISKKSLASIYSINSDKIEQALPEENDIESAVDALEEIGANFKILKEIEQDFDNIKIDDENVVNIKEVSGEEIREIQSKPQTVYAPVGFVDLRARNETIKKGVSRGFFHIFAIVLAYVLIHSYSSYLAGFLIGVFVTCVFYYVKFLLDTPSHSPAIAIQTCKDILQVPAVKEFQPLTKYEGWVNEFPDNYNPHTYHISQTQSVFLRLQGNLLRLSHTKSKVAKRALWNEPKIKPIFTHHRVYNLTGAQVSLLPVGLAKKRHWSKKYPICVTLNKDQMDFIESPIEKKRSQGNKKKFSILAQRFSKLTEENEDFECDSENSRASSPSPPSPDDSDDKLLNEALDDALKDEENEVLLDEEFESIPDDWSGLTPPDESPTQTKLFLFGRTDREKEDWFRRLKAATHKGANLPSSDTCEILTESDYIKYMMIFNKIKVESDVQWINSLVGRVFFDCLRDDNFTQGIKDKIQSKLSSIKLPYFIEGLMVTELNLGKTPPLIHKVTKPSIDERGLWIDLDVTYEGLVVLILQTKLNLMKLKQPHSNETVKERSAMFNSDLEDSPESTSDEETPIFPNPPALDSGQSGSNTSKKFIKMVDRIAESKFFQAATEYRYIKKAMEGVSNTDLRLKVEIKELVGTLVLNIPPPPSDRVWIGFRPTPELALGAQPIVGERNITFLRITSWIEKKLRLEFQKLLVIPNMEDFIVPVMSPKLPE
ncbi:testis-expressed protein 2 isoform X2 [Tribolium castaneum]|uniref:SMP-LTD domain-containing protein n=1 Tax=Tribolium castaneum TaxID=7070 RepID=D6WVQ1_TRICA|nr:PREDICTED: testis-expressed sequence 2 protein isoform X2 [Tribolium castaneum]EFA08264.1 hypothetical protein TcasGA2_TC005894 [Tribolium castaneum]|eukprot:XP_008196594.1 PREDICTED: testis-expressed sequence 2 protein isoform X2 [Tribolium castaneum]